MRLITLAAWLVVVIPVSFSKPCVAGDLWSPGTRPESWHRITRLQSVHVTTPVRSPFVSQCCQSDDPIERLAAISWIGRTQSVMHIPDLEVLLDDPIEHVRQFALETLCLLNCPEARQAVAQAIATAPEISTAALSQIGYRRRAPCGTGLWNLLDMAQGRPLSERKALLEKSFAHRWIASKSQPCPGVVHIESHLPDSVFELDQTLDLGFLCRTKRNSPVKLHRFQMQRLRNVASVNPGMDFYISDQSPFLHNPLELGELCRFKLATQYGPKTPGIYAATLRTSAPSESSLVSLPFFIRLNRSQADEEAIPEMLQQLDDLQTIERLGELRVRAAVPGMMTRLGELSDCEQMSVAGALAQIGDGRAAEALLQLAGFSCWDSGGQIDGFLNELDSTAQTHCENYLDQARERWNAAPLNLKLEPLEVLPGFRPAVALLKRPLSDAHSETVEWFLEQLISQLNSSGPAESTILHHRIAGLLVDYSRGDIEILARWLVKLEKHPQTYLETISELRNAKTNRRFDISHSDCIALLDNMSKVMMNPQQPKEIQKYAELTLKHWHRTLADDRVRSSY